MFMDDELSTLEAALAFVDAHYFSAVDGGATNGGGGGNEAVKTDPPLPAPPTKSDAKRARDIQAAARSNRKKRAELLELRVLAAALERRRDALRMLCATRQNADEAAATLSELVSDSRALDIATVAARRLNESRALNRRLRKALEQLHHVGAAVTQTLQRRLDLKCVQGLLDEARVREAESSAAAAPPTQRLDLADLRPSGRCPVFRNLHSLLQAVATEASAALAAVKCRDVLAASHTRVVQHHSLGPVIEMVSSTCVPCTLDDGWPLVMRTLSEVSTTPSFGYTATRRPNAELGVSEKDFAMAFPCAGRGGGLTVDGLALFDVVQSSDVKLFVWASIVSIRGDGTYVRERGWTALARTTVGAPGCVLHNRYEIHSAALSDESAAPMSQRLIHSLLHKARQDRNDLEGALVARFGSDVSLSLH